MAVNQGKANVLRPQGWGNAFWMLCSDFWHQSHKTLFSLQLCGGLFIKKLILTWIWIAMCPMLCNSQDPAVEWRWLAKCCWDGLRGEEGLTPRPGQALGKVIIIPTWRSQSCTRFPGRLLPQQGGARLGILRRQLLFPVSAVPPWWVFFGVGALIRGNIWDVLP